MADTPLQDVEIVAEMFQIARSGMFVSKPMFMRHVQEQFPNESAERLESCAVQLGQKLKDSDYMGYATEYSKTRRSRRSA